MRKLSYVNAIANLMYMYKAKYQFCYGMVSGFQNSLGLVYVKLLLRGSSVPSSGP